MICDIRKVENMRFTDYIADKLYEMAFRQLFALEKIEEQTPGALVHILKCFLMPDSREISHWLDEIEAFTSRMDGYGEVKPDSKRISYNNIIKQTQKKVSYDSVKKKIPYLERKYRKKFNKNEVDIAISKTLDLMRDIFLDISKDEYDMAKYADILDVKGA